jgi:hypothetical protein
MRAGGEVAWGDSGVAGFAHRGSEPCFGIEREAAFDLLRFFGVALVTGLDQHGADVLFEESDLICRESLPGRRVALRRRAMPLMLSEDEKETRGVHVGQSGCFVV